MADRATTARSGRPRRLPLLGAAVVGLLARGAEAQVPAGAEFRVNTFTTGYQWRSAVATDAAGNFVVVWNSHDQGTVLQRYRASGAPAGSEFVLPGSYAVGFPSVAATAGGRLVVAWEQSTVGPNVPSIFAQRFSTAGPPEGTTFRVNTDTTQDSTNPSVGLAPDGSFVVAWVDSGDGSGRGILARRYDAAGAPRGAALRVNTFTPDDQRGAAVVARPDGGFTVVWDSPHLGPRNVFGQRFDAAGQRDGTEFKVNTVVGGYEAGPTIAGDEAGNTLVAWSGRDRNAVFAQRYDAAGAPLGGEIRVSEPLQPGDRLGFARAAVAANGAFVVVWVANPIGPEIDIKGRRFDASGASMGAEFLVDGGRNGYPAAASDPAGNFVVTWSVPAPPPTPSTSTPGATAGWSRPGWWSIPCPAARPTATACSSRVRRWRCGRPGRTSPVPPWP